MNPKGLRKFLSKLRDNKFRDTQTNRKCKYRERLNSYINLLKVENVVPRFFSAFWNHSASTATRVENRGQISHFLTPFCKNNVRSGWNVWVIFRATLKTQTLIYFWRGAICRLRYECGWQRKSSGKKNGRPYNNTENNVHGVVIMTK